MDKHHGDACLIGPGSPQVGEPVMRRDEERWVLDNIIQADGIDWNQRIRPFG